MGKKQFEVFLNSKALEKKRERPIDWNATKREWLASLEAFYHEIEQWLAEYTASGKIEIERSEILLEEEQLGKYRAEMRVLKIGTDRVILRPIGTLLIAACGRVDMEGPKGTVKFILTGKNSTGVKISFSDGTSRGDEKAQRREELVWKIATPPPGVQFFELTPDSFFDALMKIVNG
jgi:hypothetical protein